MKCFRVSRTLLSGTHSPNEARHARLTAKSALRTVAQQRWGVTAGHAAQADGPSLPPTAPQATQGPFDGEAAFARLSPNAVRPAVGPYRRGAALIAALWIVALLSALVVGLATLLLQDVEMEGTRRQIFRARALAEMGLAIAMHPAVLPDDPILHRQISEDEFIDVEIVGEDGRLNMNALLQREDRDTLFRVFGYWGLDPQQSGSLFDALLDWTDGDDFVRVRGAESRQYNRPGMPFNRPFRSVEEIALVQGMAEIDAVYPQWRNWFSVHASGVLDLNEAEPELISAVTGADILRSQQLRARRLGQDGIANTDDDAPMPDVLTALSLLGLPISNPGQLAAVVSVNSQTRRIIARAQAGDRTREIAVVVRGSPGQAGGASQILWMGER